MMPDEMERLSNVLAEFHAGTAIMAAFIFHVLYKKGLLSADDITSAIREAADQVPDAFAASPRLAPFSALHILQTDPEMRHTTPFPWPPDRS